MSEEKTTEEKHRIVLALEKLNKSQGEAIYPRDQFVLWSKVLMLGAVIGLVYLNASQFGAGMTGHIRTAIITLIGYRIYSFLPEFADYAEEAGLLVPEDKDTARERLEKRLEQMKEQEKPEGDA